MARLHLLTAVIAATAVPMASSFAADRANAAPRIESVRLGLAGKYKIARWCPAVVTLVGGQTAWDGTVVVTFPDAAGRLAAVRTTVSVAAGVTAVVPLYVRPGGGNGELAVELFDAANVAADPRWERGRAAARRGWPLSSLARAVATTQELILTIGPPVGIDAANSLAARSASPGAAKVEVAALDSLQSLPDRWYGLEGVDAIVLATSTISTAPTAQMDALENWVKCGGRLVLGCGRTAPQWLASGGPLRRLAPGEFVRKSELRQLGSLESYVDARVSDTDHPSWEARSGDDVRLDIAVLNDVRGTIEARLGEGATATPLVVRTVQGFGQVAFAAFDLDGPPLDRWPGRPRLLNRLLGRANLSTHGETATRSLEGSPKAYTDLSQHFHAALEQFDGVSVVPFWLVVACIMAFVAVIGPLDYYLVRWRPRWTWATFAATVTAVTCGAFVASNELQPPAPVVNQVDVIDVDLAGTEGDRAIRGATWTSLYASAPATWNCAVAPPGWVKGSELAASLLEPATPIANSGLLEVGPRRQPYWLALDAGAARNLTVSAGGTLAVTARYGGVLPSNGGALELDAVGNPVGPLPNPLGLNFQEATLYVGGKAFAFHPISDTGGSADKLTGRWSEGRLAISALQRRRQLDDQESATPYDPSRFDVPRIVELMLLYAAAGGRAYTGMDHREQRYLDAGELLTRDRAVLVGRVAGNAARVLWQEADQGTTIAVHPGRSYTFVRYFIPIHRPGERRP